MPDAPVDALVLVGGQGSRLRPVVRDIPKPMAPVLGRPFLSFILDQLAEAQLKRVILCAGYKAEQLEEAFGDRYRTLRLLYSNERSALGTAGGIRLALQQVAGEFALVMNGDSYIESDMARFIGWYRSEDISDAVMVTYVDDVRPYGEVLMDECHRVSAFTEKREGTANRPGWINAGAYLLSRDTISAIPAGQPCSIERDVFPTIVEDGLYAYSERGRFIDIGTPSTYRDAERFFAGLRGDL